jgi:hypothetical protein
LFFHKIFDFFNFKTNNDFDFAFFFEKLSFDFILFNKIFNNIFFSKFLIAISKLGLIDGSLKNVLSHYSFLHTDVPLHNSSNSFTFDNFTFVPSVYQNTEREVIYFFDLFFNFFYKFEKIIG